MERAAFFTVPPCLGNSTSASALLCAFTGASAEEAAGKGAGLDDAGVIRKREVLTVALALHQVDKNDAIGVLAAIGGFEIAMMSGFVLGAASKRLPVVMDGFISSSAFLAARVFHADIGDYVFFGHRSAELAHARLLKEAGARPLLDLEMRLGEGTGAALAIGLLTSGVSLYREMATFAEASVSDVQTKEQMTK
jgi:nicotinate-nucleotide--dimethylbenzimidazole phosphoribosyltransferase